MAFRAPIEKLSSAQHFELASSPHVKIYVGPEKKLYSIPKDIMAYYSPYFDKCFKAGWKEAEEGVLRLPDENPDFFDVMQDYFRHGQAKYDIPYKDYDEAVWGVALRKALEFLIFVDFYDVFEAAPAVTHILSYIFWDKGLRRCLEVIGTEEMLCFLEKLHPEGDAINIIANVAVENLARSKIESDTSNEEIHALLRGNHNLAAAMWRQVRFAPIYDGHMPKGSKKIQFVLLERPL